MRIEFVGKKRKRLATPETAEETKAMEAALKKMNPELKKVYDDCSKVWANLDSQEIMGKHQVGRSIVRVMSDEKKYGADAAGNPAAAMRVSAQTVHNCRRLAETWTVKQAKELAARRSKGGKAIPVSHLSYLTNFPEAQRNKFIEMFFDRDLTYRDMVALARKERTNKRAPKVPSPQVGTRGLCKHLKKLLSQKATFCAGVFDEIEKESQSEKEIAAKGKRYISKYANEDVIKLVEEVSDAIGESLDLLGEYKRRYQVAMDSLKQSLARAKQPPSKTPSAAPQPSRAGNGAPKRKKGPSSKGAAAEKPAVASKKKKKVSKRSPADAIAAARGDNGASRPTKKKRKKATASA